MRVWSTLLKKCLIFMLPASSCAAAAGTSPAAAEASPSSESATTATKASSTPTSAGINHGTSQSPEGSGKNRYSDDENDQENECPWRKVITAIPLIRLGGTIAPILALRRRQH